MKTTSGIAIALLCLLMLAMVSGPSFAKTRTLSLYNWPNYISPKVLKAFEKKYDVKIVRNFFNSDAEMFSKLQAGGDSQYDVVFPADSFVPRLVEAGLLQPLNKQLIPNYRNLMPEFQDPPYDPDGKYTAAFQWGTAGIVYNDKNIHDPSKSWSLVFDPEVNSSYPFSMLPGPETTLSMACAYLGYGYPCSSKKEWTKAARLVAKTKKRNNFNGFYGGVPVYKRMARGVISVGVGFNGDYIKSKRDNPKAFKHIKFFVPKEGSERWVDNMAIPAHAPHPKLANEFINFILSAKVGAKVSNFISYASPNQAAIPYLNDILKNKIIMPTDEVKKKLHFDPYLKGGKLQLVHQLWTSVLAQ